MARALEERERRFSHEAVRVIEKDRQVHQSIELLERRVQERTGELYTLLQMSRDIASTLHLEPLLAKILEGMGDVVPYGAAAIFSLEGEATLVLLDARGAQPRELLARRWDLREASHIRMVLDHRRPLVIPDVRAMSLPARAWRHSWGAQLGRLSEASVSWLGVPLLVKGRLIGALTLEHPDTGYFSPLRVKLALAFANQAAVAIENARLYEASERLGMLEERQRIARELHDSVSQALFGIGLAARTARAWLDRDPARAVESIDYILNLAEAGLVEMRALIFELRPDSLEQGGLVAALLQHAAGLRARYGVRITTSLEGEPIVSREVREALFRVAHEALNNTIKHAQASMIGIELAQVQDAVMLSIHDDGVGFDPREAHPGHFGLQSMRERIEREGGVLTIESRPNEGTTVRATLPLSPVDVDPARQLGLPQHDG
jgi:signal transduction histidine kinase